MAQGRPWGEGLRDGEGGLAPPSPPFPHPGLLAVGIYRYNLLAEVVKA